MQAAIIAGDDVGSVLVDITPHSLGIKCLDYPPGLRVPVPLRPDHAPQHAVAGQPQRSLHHGASTTRTEVEIEVYQGESDDIRNNHRIGNFLIDGLAQVPAGNQIVVQLDLNLDGMLKVSAREKATGLQKQVTIENALAKFEREERGRGPRTPGRTLAQPG